MTTSTQDSTPGMIEVTVASSAEVDIALDEAIGTVRSAATRHQTGIMVTRTGPGHYIVRAHPAVPFGLIRQQHERPPRTAGNPVASAAGLNVKVGDSVPA